MTGPNQNDAGFGEQPHFSRGEDLLPPVEPPSARFILQLFVAPALIVLAIVAVWLSFTWLVRRSMMGPEQLIQRLDEGPGIARWQRASDLALVLPQKQNVELRQDSTQAAHVAQILEREIDRAASASGADEHEIQFRYYLTQVLGQFDVPEGNDILVKAAQTKRDPEEWLVCYGALQALARRIELGLTQNLNQAELESLLIRLSGDDDPSIRSASAFALGKLGSQAAIERLEGLTDDPDLDTRSNAAVALAHRGNEKAIHALAEMLDPDELMRLPETPLPPSKHADHDAMVEAAIEAAESLAQNNPQANFDPLLSALDTLATARPETLSKARLSLGVASEARRAAQRLRSSR